MTFVDPPSDILPQLLKLLISYRIVPRYNDTRLYFTNWRSTLIKLFTLYGSGQLIEIVSHDSRTIWTKSLHKEIVPISLIRRHMMPFISSFQYNPKGLGVAHRPTVCSVAI